MEVKAIAHNDKNELTLALIDGRGFVHGSVLDAECASRNREIDRLRTALYEIAHEPLDDEGYGDAKRIAREALEFKNEQKADSK